MRLLAQVGDHGVEDGRDLFEVRLALAKCHGGARVCSDEEMGAMSVLGHMNFLIRKVCKSSIISKIVRRRPSRSSRRHLRSQISDLLVHRRPSARPSPTFRLHHRSTPKTPPRSVLGERRRRRFFERRRRLGRRDRRARRDDLRLDHVCDNLRSGIFKLDLKLSRRRGGCERSLHHERGGPHSILVGSRRSWSAQDGRRGKY